MKKTTILLLGDVMGPAAADHVGARLWSVRTTLDIDFVVANCENCALGNGIDKQNVDKLLSGGCDVLTSGNHVFKKPEAKTILEDCRDVIRPCNYPPEVPGAGHVIKNIGACRVLVMNVMGVIYMEPLSNPIRSVEKILAAEKGNYDVSVLDVHAEATSEKQAIAYYFDGKIDIIVGTHTHVATADEHIFPKGTAYVTDLGMCGPDNSVLGVEPSCIIEKLTTNMPVRFILSQNRVTAHGVIVTIGEGGKPEKIERITF
ncbi:MAG: YmdB family metallophosphoesterase [Clostridia bacterium]|nr:YmdB family metallophosphoesterase [Clostridia bacterium]